MRIDMTIANQITRPMRRRFFGAKKMVDMVKGICMRVEM